MAVRYELFLLTVVIEFSGATPRVKNSSAVFCPTPGYVMNAIAFCAPPDALTPTADLGSVLFTVGSICKVACKKGYFFPDGTVLVTRMCKSVFDERIDSIVLKWLPVVDHCGLYYKD